MVEVIGREPASLVDRVHVYGRRPLRSLALFQSSSAQKGKCLRPQRSSFTEFPCNRAAPHYQRAAQSDSRHVLATAP
jgi:hypothetical protein